MLRNSDKLQGVELILILSLLPVCQIELSKDVAIHHDLCFLSNALLVIPLLKDECTKYLDSVLVGNINPAGRWYGHCVMAKVDEDVNILPVEKAILGLLDAELFAATEWIETLSILLLKDTCRNVVAHEDLALVRLGTRVPRDAGFVHVEVLWIKPG